MAEETPFKTPSRKWWDGDWDTLEEAVRSVVRDEVEAVFQRHNDQIAEGIRRNNIEAFKREELEWQNKFRNPEEK